MVHGPTELLTVWGSIKRDVEDGGSTWGWRMDCWLVCPRGLRVPSGWMTVGNAGKASGAGVGDAEDVADERGGVKGDEMGRIGVDDLSVGGVARLTVEPAIGGMGDDGWGSI